MAVDRHSGRQRSSRVAPPVLCSPLQVAGLDTALAVLSSSASSGLSSMSITLTLGSFKARLEQDPTLTKVHTLLGRRGVVVSDAASVCTTELDFGQRRTTVRVADCDPGAEVQVDFGRSPPTPSD